MKTLSALFPAFLCTLVIAACGSGSGKDSLSSSGTTGYSTSSECLLCHTDRSASVLDPLVTNGSGTAGKHVLHVTERGIECLVCHFHYKEQATHMNGILDTADPAARIVSFDSVNPSGAWIDDTGPGAGRCSLLSCHGPQEPDWYGSSSDLPDCVVCHTGALDPANTNGSGTEGKHILHVSDRGIGCSTCHADYTRQRTHMNGTKDTANAAVVLVRFDSTNSSGTWINDTGAATGSCASLACHGPQNPEWYGPSSDLPDCSFCHTGALDPLTINGSGTEGKHILHVSGRNIACLSCHFEYTHSLSHMNGTKDTGDPSINLVRFDATNPLGSWINDTGPMSGRCSSLACHGAQTPEWYGASSNMPDCGICHAGAYDPVSLDSSRAAGKHAEHVTVNHIACAKCHNGYPGSATHMNGTVNVADPAVNLVFFEGFNSSGVWSGAAATCSATYCHSNGTSVSTGAAPAGTSPSWNSPADSGCNACHGDPSLSGWTASFPPYVQDRPKSNDHDIHRRAGIGCNSCHVTTTHDNVTIFDTSKHINGVYDVAPDTSVFFTIAGVTVPVNFSYVYDPGGGVCSNISCHQARGGIPTTYSWGHIFMQTSIRRTYTGNNCEVEFGHYTIGDVTPPYTFYWNFGDGTVSDLENPVHVFPAGTYSLWVNLTVRDYYRHPATARIQVLFDSSHPCH
jgi:predicted CxxxxCH...CXXCH cytochrome family protein